MRPDVLIIVGQTASGKSDVALEVAKITNGEIVNADSRQIYRFCDAGTAKPSPEALKAVPHHLYDFLDPKQTYSAGDYARDASGTIQEILSRKRTPVVVGGTGLYIRSLLDGLSPLPKRNEAVRDELRALALEKGNRFLHDELKKADPASAEKIPFQNTQRLIRALEVFRLTGKSLSEWHGGAEKFTPAFNPVLFGLRWSKDSLKDRITARTINMLMQMLAETKVLLEKGYEVTDPGLQSIGYSKAVQCVWKQISAEQFFESMLKDTLHYAKRQMTWFRRDTRIRWVDLAEPFQPESVADAIRRSI